MTTTDLRRVFTGGLIALAAITAPVSGGAQTESGLDDVLRAFWSAADVSEAAAQAADVLALRPAFDELYARLRRGREYSENASRGVLTRTHQIGGVDHHYLILIPVNYDPGRRWPVQWDLHGGMGQPEWKRPDGSWSPGWAAVAEPYNDGHIVVVPAGWWDSMWWEWSQVDNFRAIMRELKGTWNIDENRVFLFGTSDGAVAEWFYAFREPDPWVMYLGWVGFPARLTAREMRPDGQMHMSNLFGQSFYLRNGTRDRIVNIDVMRGYMKGLRQVEGATFDYREFEGRGHNLNLSREEQLEPFVEYFRTAIRDPLPEQLSWATERTDRYNRRLWLVIDELQPGHPVDTSNILPRIVGPNVPDTLPPDPMPWGRVELERDGNTVRAKTVGVRRFTLMLSPEEFDFTAPVHVLVDGVTVFHARLQRDPAVLLKWAARDNDRSMLFGAELSIEVPATE